MTTYRKLFSVVLVVSLFGCGQTPAPAPAPKPAATSTSTAPSNAGVRLAPVCVAQDESGTSLNDGRLGATEGTTICITPEAGVTYLSNSLHLVPANDGTVELRLSCSHPDAEDSLRNSSSAPKFALVAGSKVVKIYERGQSSEVKTACGLLGTAGIEEAIHICQAATDTWEQSPDKCFELCANGDQGTICVEHDPN